jgi:hypothetical protein
MIETAVWTKDGMSGILMGEKEWILKDSYDKEVQDLKDRFEYWANSRGLYILNQHYVEELEEFLFNGTSKTLTNWEDIKKLRKEELEKK